MLVLIEDTILASVKLLPFLFLTFILMDYVHQKPSARVKEIIKSVSKSGPFIGTLFGLLPGCGFAVAAANLYSGNLITVGTLIAVFLATSDDMLSVLIDTQVDTSLILLLLGFKLVCAVFFGYIIDAFAKHSKKQPIEGYEAGLKVLFSKDGLSDKHGLFLTGFLRSLKVEAYILIFNFLANLAFYLLGQENIIKSLPNIPLLETLISTLVGILPSCHISVYVTVGYLKKLITFGSTMAVLIAGSGAGTLVLIKQNRSALDTIKIIAMILFIAICAGAMIDGMLTMAV